MGDILVGTCSWTDRALVTSGWYPPGARSAEGLLRHYASRFFLVEVDSTYYGLPSADRARQWARRTPDGFVFDVKAFAALTGHSVAAKALPADLRPADGARRSGHALDPGVVRELGRRFAQGVRPLAEAGRLGAVLFQFPPWFAAGAWAEERVARCRALVAGLPVAVEFRHPSWLLEPRLGRTLDLLRSCRLPLTAVDTAQDVPGALPPVAVATSPQLAYVRLHGRSRSWGSGSKEDRFRHRYRAAELAGWVPRIRALARHSAEVHVLLNNCCGDAAVCAAELLVGLLRQDGLAVRESGTAESY